MTSSATFEVTIPELPAFRSALRRYPSIAEPILQRAIAGTNAVLAKHTTRSNVPWRTGNLLQSFRYRTGRLWGMWFPTAHYAYYVHQGTGIYGKYGARIFPQLSKALYWQGARHPVRSISGQRPQPYMARVRDAAQEEVLKLFQGAQVQINRQIAEQIRRI